ncbi:hypothetical protein ACLOJK_033508 [Asimina triloba]
MQCIDVAVPLDACECIGGAYLGGEELAITMPVFTSKHSESLKKEYVNKKLNGLGIVPCLPNHFLPYLVSRYGTCHEREALKTCMDCLMSTSIPRVETQMVEFVGHHEYRDSSTNKWWKFNKAPSVGDLILSTHLGWKKRREHHREQREGQEPQLIQHRNHSGGQDYEAMIRTTKRQEILRQKQHTPIISSLARYRISHARPSSVLFCPNLICHSESPPFLVYDYPARYSLSLSLSPDIYAFVECAQKFKFLIDCSPTTRKRTEIVKQASKAETWCGASGGERFSQASQRRGRSHMMMSAWGWCVTAHRARRTSFIKPGLPAFLHAELHPVSIFPIVVALPRSNIRERKIDTNGGGLHVTQPGQHPGDTVTSHGSSKPPCCLVNST